MDVSLPALRMDSRNKLWMGLWNGAEYLMPNETDSIMVDELEWHGRSVDAARRRRAARQLEARGRYCRDR